MSRANKYGTWSFLPNEEIHRRQKIANDYFQGGRVYRVRKNFHALSKELDRRGNKKLVDVNRGEVLLCCTCEIEEGKSSETIEFIYHDKILRYVGSCRILCCMLDLVEFENNE